MGFGFGILVLRFIIVFFFCFLGWFSVRMFGLLRMLGGLGGASCCRNCSYGRTNEYLHLLLITNVAGSTRRNVAYVGLRRLQYRKICPVVVIHLREL